MARETSQLKPNDKEQFKPVFEKAPEIGADAKCSESDLLLGQLRQLPPKPSAEAAGRRKTK